MMKEAGTQERLARREFCHTLALGSVALLAAPSLAGQAGAAQRRALHYPAKRIEGAEGLMPGSALVFNYPTEHNPALLVRAQTGEFYAYGQRCTHRACSVNFDRQTNRFECPCHRGAFELTTGQVLQGPPRRPLEQIELELRAGGEVWAVGEGAS
jgi:Rieske Fe-S protein